MKNNNKKFKLVRTFTEVTIITGLSLALATFTGPKLNNETIPYTQADLNNNIIFESQLKEIDNTYDICFNNQELYDIISSQVEGQLTVEKLREITELKILNTLTNTDLSDLKYLPNLSIIEIYDNYINLEDIKYNQNLYLLSLDNCTIKNSSCIPNSTNAIFLDHCTCTDNQMIIPYYTERLYFIGSHINNLTLKNPSNLLELKILGDIILDMNQLGACTNLKSLDIKLCSNIKNGSVLRKFKNLETVILDEYSSIWLDTYTLKTLPVDKEDSIILENQISELDKLANSLIANKDTAPDYLKIQAISSYILSNLEYDEQVAEDKEANMSLINEYNIKPITYALNNDEAICINYACLFAALANRLDLDSYQMFSLDHTWNIVKEESEYKGYDLTFLESGPIVKLNTGEFALIADSNSEDVINKGDGNHLYFYEFNIDEFISDAHLADATPKEIEDTIINIGYINENSLVKLIEKNEVRLYRATTFLKSYLCLLLLTIGINIISQNKKTEKRLIKNERNYC